MTMGGGGPRTWNIYCLMLSVRGVRKIRTSNQIPNSSKRVFQNRLPVVTGDCPLA